MTITLPPEWEKRVAETVAHGKYPTADDLVSESLRRLFAEEERREAALADLRAKIQEGIDSADREPGMDGDEFFAELDDYIEELTGKRPEELLAERPEELAEERP